MHAMTGELEWEKIKALTETVSNYMTISVKGKNH